MFNFLSDNFAITKDKTHVILKIFKLKMPFRLKENNVIVLTKKNGKKVYNPRIKGLKVDFLSSNSLLELFEPLPRFKNVKLLLGQDCRVKIKNSIHEIKNLSIDLPVPKAVVNIGENCSVHRGDFFVDYNSTLNIGDDCMFSAGVIIRSGDSHVVKDLDGNILSKPSNINIGDHVWVGLNALIIKNTEISANSIVGANAVVTKKFLSTNIAVAGNPAKIVSENIDWSRDNLSRVCVDETKSKKQESAVRL